MKPNGMIDLTKELSIAKDLAQRAGEVMRRYFRVENGQEQKSDGSPVTIADTTINHLVIEELSKHFSDPVIGEEESTGQYGAGRQWICDPVDGTKAYVWGVPTAMFSLGFTIDGIPMLGVAYDPFLDVLYEAVRGGGAFCNSTPIHVSQNTLTEGYVALTSNPARILRHPKFAEHLIAQGAKLATFSGSVYKMCLIARGSLLAFAEEGVNTHDAAAAHVIVEEAGGTVTGLTGESLDYSKRFRGAIFSNGVVHEQLVASMQGIDIA